jgi:hypothetical protein
LKLLRQAGMDNLQPGIESLSTPILKLMRKGVTALQTVQLLKWASELGIEMCWNLLMGFPGEDPAEYERMAAMVPSLLHLEPPWSAGPIRMDRFSPHFCDPGGWGFTNVRPAANYRVVYPFPDEVLERLACFFEFDYQDGRDPAAYTAPLIERVEYWRANYCPGALTSISIGDTLTIHDRRPSAVAARTALRGAWKALYEFCDEAHSLRAIHTHLRGSGFDPDEETIRRQLDAWVDQRLALSDGDWYLSLAVPVDDLAASMSDDALIREALGGAIAELGEAFRRRRMEEGE